MNDLLAQSKSLTMIKLFESLLQHKLKTNEIFSQISQIGFCFKKKSKNLSILNLIHVVVTDYFSMFLQYDSNPMIIGIIVIPVTVQVIHQLTSPIGQ